MLSRRFTSMATQIELLLDAPSSPAARGALEAAEAEVHRIAARFSRFRWDSELSELNRSGDHDASSELALVVRLAVAAREKTSGRFDPTVHEVIAEQESADVPKGTILQVFRSGYKLKDQLVRTAQVVVAKPPAPAAS